MVGGDDPDNRRDFPGGWREDPRNAFTETGRTPEQQSIFAYVQALLRMRREHPALANGRLWHIGGDETSYVFVRDTEEESALVVFNNSGAGRELRLPVDGTPTQSFQGLTSIFGEATASFSGKELQISAPAQSVSIFVLN
jgi:glycosidase